MDRSASWHSGLVVVFAGAPVGTVTPAAVVDGERPKVPGCRPGPSFAVSFAEADAGWALVVVVVAGVALAGPSMEPGDEVPHAANSTSPTRPAMRGASGLLTPTD